MANIQNTSYERMSPASFPQTAARTSTASLRRSAPSKTRPYLFLDLRGGSTPERSWEMVTPLPGESLTRNTGECPNADAASSLLQILQTAVPEKYYLRPKACLGILRRASARGKELPEVLRKALVRQSLEH